MTNNNTNTAPRRSFGRRLWWWIKAFLISLPLMALLVVGGMVGYRALQQAQTNLLTRLVLAESGITLLRGDVDGLLAANRERQRQFDGLEADVAALDGRLVDLQTALDAQAEVLAATVDGLATTGADLTAVQEETGMLTENLVALQGDINANTTQIDNLGGDVDAARADVVALRGEIDTLGGVANAAVAEAQAAALISDTVTLEMGEMRQTLALFRAWELVTRARFRLLENNAGLAAADVTLAAALLDPLTAALPPEQAALLAQAQARLRLAQDGLAADPAGAALDLEQAWSDLDAALALRIPLPETAAAEATATPGASP